MDGRVWFWHVKCEGNHSIKRLFSVPVTGIVNCLEFTSSGSHLVVGVGQEHKLGRWYRQPAARNSVVVIPLKKKWDVLYFNVRVFWWVKNSIVFSCSLIPLFYGKKYAKEPLLSICSQYELSWRLTDCLIIQNIPVQQIYFHLPLFYPFLL